MLRAVCSLTILLTIMAFSPVVADAADHQDRNSHPIFNEQKWTLVHLCTDFKTDTISESYENSDGNYLMIVDKYFGEQAVKRFVANRKRGRVSPTWYQIEIRGQWRHVTGMKNLKFDEIYDDSGQRIAVTIIVLDDNDNEIARREIKRK